MTISMSDIITTSPISHEEEMIPSILTQVYYHTLLWQWLWGSPYNSTTTIHNQQPEWAISMTKHH